MGHQLSKQTVVIASSKSKKPNNNKIQENLKKSQEEQDHHQKTPTVEEASAEVRQIIIKIQLAKMENGNGESSTEEQEQQQQQLPLAEGVTLSADTLNANEQIVNMVTVGAAAATSTTTTGTAAGVSAGTSTGAIRTAGSSTEAPKTNERQLVNNNNFAGSVASASTAVKSLQLHDTAKNDEVDVNVNVHIEGEGGEDDDESEMATTAALSSLLRRRRTSSSSSANGAEGVDYCEVLEPQTVNEMLSSGTQRAQALSSSVSSSVSSGNSCCRSRSSKALSVGGIAVGGGAGGAEGATTSKRRCCKCKCRDAFRGLRGMLESNKDKKDTVVVAPSVATTTSRSKTRNTADRRSTPPTLSAGSSSSSAVVMQRHRQRNSVAVAEPSQLAIWAGPATGGDVIIRISSQPHQQQQQLLVEPAVAAAGGASGCICANGNNGNNNGTTNIRLVASTATDAASNIMPQEQQQQQLQQSGVTSYGSGVRVHSQIDFMHCLVPDLERIFNSSFYWGKMDRYEAERLLEGKPEGTFLLRDSAQEDFLFSVTFRKYGRTLHARIEQSGHKFSFDCHDPCVFAALTVTGLLEHYKDPSCVMFFEPCLTMPLHRRQTFSLQQLARATIVSNTTYDGINQLELPSRLKSYLKEYHYKQKLRVKLCAYSAPYYANI